MDIKNIFIKYNMTTTESLSMQSDQIKYFMSDSSILTTYATFIPKAIAAMQALETTKFKKQKLRR